MRSAAARLRASLLLIPAGLFVAVAATSPAEFHWSFTFAGDVERWTVAAAVDGARRSLWLDTAFAASVAAIGTWVVVSWGRRWTPERRRLGAWRLAPWTVLAAGTLDLAENALSLAALDTDPPAAWLPPTVAAIAWWKLATYGFALVAVVGVVVGPAVAPVLRPLLRRIFGVLDTGSHPPVTVPSTPPRDRGEGLGIAVSGGGIRAASVALGALRALDVSPGAGRRSIWCRARWVTAVSGGAYTVGGWRITRRPDAAVVTPPPTSEHDGLFDVDGPWARSVARRRRYLDNGYGSLLGGVVGAVVRSAIVLGAVAATAYVVGWAAGSLVRSDAVHPGFTTDTALAPARLMWPWLPTFVAGLVVWVASGAVRDHFRARLRSAGRGLVAASALLAAALVGVPFGVQRGRALWNRLADLVTSSGRADAGAGLVGVLAALGVVSAVVGVVRAQVVRRWLYLGGVALALAWFLLAGKVADSFARADEAWPRRWQWDPPAVHHAIPVLLVAAVGVLALADAIASHRLTLGGIYRKRLSQTFALRAPDAGAPPVPLPPLGYAAEPLWPAYADADGPELIIVATAHSSRRESGGLKGVGFTFRPRSVTLHRVPGADDSVPSWQYPSGSWWDGYPRGWLVSRSMALSGAAFASAMGRQALGTTNALLAATNLRLGAWVPNPRNVAWFDDRATSPRVHLGYLLKEVLGRYDLDRDPFVYVADGGHRENLALVELLRERPSVVLVVDASGDARGSFTTLRQAVELARRELDVSITIDWAPIVPGELDDLPADCVTEGHVRYGAGADGAGPARLLYGRAQLSRVSPPELVRFAAANPPFPDYPTGDQFLRAEEFEHLVALGEHVGTRLRERLEGT